jgi:hypothetical protein
MTKRYLKFLRNGNGVTKGEIYEVERVSSSGEYVIIDDDGNDHYWDDRTFFEVIEVESRMADVGEKILVTNPDIALGSYERGDILTVGGYYGSIGVEAVELDEGPYLVHEEYEVIQEPIKFEVGDIVRVEVEGTPSGGWGYVENRDIGVVNDVAPYGVFVDFPRQHHWRAEKSELVLVAKAGDRKDKGRE